MTFSKRQVGHCEREINDSFDLFFIIASDDPSVITFPSLPHVPDWLDGEVLLF